MKARPAISIAVVCGCACLATWKTEILAPARAQEEGVTAAAVATLPNLIADYEYVGHNKCKKCHIKEYKSWEGTKMAKALDTLKPGEHAEAKTKAGLDPNKDYTKDEKCLPCHVTGFGKPGGYAVPDPSDKKAVKEADRRANVGCEACHSAGGAYLDVFEDIMKSKRKYKVEELYAVGLTKMGPEACTGCHNDKSPTYDPSNPFDFEKMKDKDTHEHVPLTQRE